MNNSDFNKLTEACCEEIRETLSIKAEQYAGDVDRLQNFKDVSLMNNESNIKALWGMVSKHIVALKEYIKEIEREYQDAQHVGEAYECADIPEKEWLEKTGDIACYLLPLLRGLLIDRGLLPEYAERIGINESDS